MKLDRAPVKRVRACARVADSVPESPLSGATERSRDRCDEVAW